MSLGARIYGWIFHPVGMLEIRWHQRQVVRLERENAIKQEWTC